MSKWDRRRTNWEARQAEWEARWSRAERSRERWAGIARLVLGLLALAGAAGIGWLRDRERGREAKQIAVTGVVALLGVLLVLLGLLSALLSGGASLLIGSFLCLAPAAVLVVLAGLWVRERGRGASPAAKGSGQAAAAQQVEAEPPQRVEPEAARAQKTPLPVRGGAPPSSRAADVKRDPSYYRQRATGYRRRIQSIIRNRRSGPLSDVLKSVVSNLQRWEERVGQLADRLGTFESDAIIQRDIKEVPAEIARLRRQVDLEADPELRQQMERTLKGYQGQQDLLETLVRLMRRTRLQLDDTIAAMGMIYSQVQVLDAMDIDSAKTTRIAEEIDEQVRRLNDLLSALGEAYEQPEEPDDLADAARRIRLERGGITR